MAAAFDATQYSFFDLSGGGDGGLGAGDDGGLGDGGDSDGGIEAGVDAPPEEDALGGGGDDAGGGGDDDLDLVDDDADVSLDDVTDLSYAAMFAAGMAAAGLGSGDGGGDAGADAGFHLPNLLMADDPPPPSRAAARAAPPPLGSGAGLLGAGSRLEPVPPPVLRGLPAGAPLSVYAAALRSASSAAGGGGAPLFGGPPPPPPQPHHRTGAPVSASDLEAQMRARAVAAAAAAVAPPQGGGLSAAEVEARMRGHQAAAALAAGGGGGGPPPGYGQQQAPVPWQGYPPQRQLQQQPPPPAMARPGGGGPPPAPLPGQQNVWAARAAAAAAAGRGPPPPHPGAPGGPRVVLVRGPPPGVGGRGPPYQPQGGRGPPFPGGRGPYGGRGGFPPQQQHGPGPYQQQQHPPHHHQAAPPHLSTVARRRLHGSSAMAPDEVDFILRAQWRAVHAGPPYVEDYLYQARVHAAGPAAVRAAHARPFAPEGLRDFGGFEDDEVEGALGGRDASMACVRLEGLGRIAHSNLRRPRPLMDLGGGPAAPKPATAAAAGGKGGGASAAAPSPPGTPSAPAPARRRLADEPRLAARLVVEECAVRALDVDDVDRLWAVSQQAFNQNNHDGGDPFGAGPRPDGPALASRRASLMASIAASMRLPDEAVPAGGGSGDAVFSRLMALPKGRAALAHGLRLLTSPLAWGAGGGGGPSRPPLPLLWATLRNAADLFAEPERGEGDGADAAAREAAEVDATAAVAAAAAAVSRRLPTPGLLCDALDALSKGTLGERAAAAASPADALLPLLPPMSLEDEAAGVATATAARPWLTDVLCALLLRAQELGLAGIGSIAPSGPGTPSPADAARWAGSVGGLWALLAKHVDTLVAVHAMAVEAGAAEAAAYAVRVVPVALIRTALPHAGEAQADAVKAGLAKLQG